MDWPRLPLVSLWREETTLVRGCLHAVLALLLKPACPPGKFRGTDTEVGPSRPPGIMWPGRLGLEKGAGREGSALAPRICPADPGHVLLGESRPLAGAWGAPPAWQPPFPSGGPPDPWRALLMGLPQQTAWGRWPSAALAALRRARPLSARRDQRGRDSRASVELETSLEKVACVLHFLLFLRLWLR